MRRTAIQDVVSKAYAEEYAQVQFRKLDQVDEELDRLQSKAGISFEGSHILDLCAGPGQFTAMLARRGARVVWHDPSSAYLEIAKAKCREFAAEVRFTLAGFEDLSMYEDGAFEVVFNRVSWYYAANERNTLNEIVRVLSPGGFFWLHTHNWRLIPTIKHPMKRAVHAACFLLHELTGVKLCHVPSRSKRLKHWLFSDFKFRPVFEWEDGWEFIILGQKRPRGGRDNV